jgi:hypothetical protein
MAGDGLLSTGMAGDETGAEGDEMGDVGDERGEVGDERDDDGDAGGDVEDSSTGGVTWAGAEPVPEPEPAANAWTSPTIAAITAVIPAVSQ